MLARRERLTSALWLAVLAVFALGALRTWVLAPRAAVAPDPPGYSCAPLNATFERRYASPLCRVDVSPAPFGPVKPPVR